MKKILAAVSMAAVLLTGAFALDAAIANNEKVEKVEAVTSIANTKGVKIYVVGDSTFSLFNDPYFYPRYGIGTKIQDFIADGKAEVINLAMSGRSSKSFLTEANYTTLKDNIKKGDWLIIGFGHNDEKTEEARYTDPTGSKETPGSFKNSLYENYVKLALDKKATPVLCTPIVRRAPKKAYEGAVVHVTEDVGEFKGGDYAQAIRDLAAECKVLCVDNTKFTKELYESVGDAGTLKFHAWLGHKEASVDNTHLNTYGASKLAFNTVKELSAKNKKFAKLLKKDIAEPAENILTPNPSYVIPKYEQFKAAEMASTNFKTTAPWYGTVFGDCGGQEKISNPDIYEIVENGKTVMMHSGTKDGKTAGGKISSSSDGIAFYFQQLPAKKDFTMTAKVKVNNFAKNNQVAFGLMVRDDVYIDKYDNTIKSNYAAAGVIGLAKADCSTSFARVDTAQQQTVSTVGKPEAGKTYSLKITKTGNTVTTQFDNDVPVTYTLSLTDVDADYVYAGCFTARAAYVEYSDIEIK